MYVDKRAADHATSGYPAHASVKNVRLDSDASHTWFLQRPFSQSDENSHGAPSGRGFAHRPVAPSQWRPSTQRFELPKPQLPPSGSNGLHVVAHQPLLHSSSYVHGPPAATWFLQTDVVWSQ
jgi:hypothetical protein